MTRRERVYGFYSIVYTQSNPSGDGVGSTLLLEATASGHNFFLVSAVGLLHQH
jgi:hypothetical protein